MNLIYGCQKKRPISANESSIEKKNLDNFLIISTQPYRPIDQGYVYHIYLCLDHETKGEYGKLHDSDFRKLQRMIMENNNVTVFVRGYFSCYNVGVSLDRQLLISLATNRNRLLQNRPYLLNRFSGFSDIGHFRKILKHATRLYKYIYKISSIEV